MRTCQQLQKVAGRLLTFLDTLGIEPTKNAAVEEVFSVGVRALRQQAVPSLLNS